MELTPGNSRAHRKEETHVINGVEINYWMSFRQNGPYTDFILGSQRVIMRTEGSPSPLVISANEEGMPVLDGVPQDRLQEVRKRICDKTLRESKLPFHTYMFLSQIFPTNQ